jgi:AraC-like DNA-binding protein
MVSTSTGKMSWRIPKSLIDSDDLILIKVDTGAWACTERGQEVHLGPGEATICSNSETASGTAFGRRSMVRVPISAIGPMARDITGRLQRPVRADTPVLRLLQTYLGGIDDHAAEPPLQRLAAAHVHDLLALLIGATRDAAELARSRGLAAARLESVKDDIARNLGDDLSVGAIALRHQVTPRYIQMLFESEGTTFTEYVLAIRLACAHRLLSDPRRAGDKVSTVAFECGFGDLSYFHRAFRRRYGTSPADVRAQARRDR